MKRLIFFIIVLLLLTMDVNATPVTYDACAVDGTANWSTPAGTLAFATDHYTLTHNGTGITYFPTATFTLTAGKLYALRIDFKDGTASGKSIEYGVANVGGVFVSSRTITTSATGAYEILYFVADGTERYIGIYVTGLVDNNIQIKNLDLIPSLRGRGLMGVGQ